MTTKNAIIATVVILVGGIGLGVLLIFLFFDPSKGNAKERAEMLGQGLGTIVMIPVAIIWIVWAIRFSRERDRKAKKRSRK